MAAFYYLRCNSTKVRRNKMLIEEFGIQETKELAFQLGDRYICIQETSEGYDYTIYDMNYLELDGGVYDNPDITIREALSEIELDLKEPIHCSKLEGNIHFYDELIPMDFEELTEKVENAEMNRFKEHTRAIEEERRAVDEFKVTTSKMFHEINGLTPEDIELNVCSYLQSKIDQYQISVKIIGVAIYGSRCRGMERESSDLDIVVEYIGYETEDNLFNIFNEDGFMIGGVKIDINPITEEKTGTLGEYLQVAEAFLLEKQANQSEKGQTIVTYTVAECSEFHGLGEFHENIESADKAISIFNRIPPERMNGIPGIGINVHVAGTESYEDVSIDILVGGIVDLEILDYVPEITNNPKAITAIEDLIAKLPDTEVRGSLEGWKTA